jgi:hypothetical protein
MQFPPVHLRIERVRSTISSSLALSLAAVEGRATLHLEGPNVALGVLFGRGCHTGSEGDGDEQGAEHHRVQIDLVSWKVKAEGFRC